jgi:hypothetical protein
VGGLILSKRDRSASKTTPGEDWDRRLTYVCCDDSGSCTCGIYLRIGGGREAFDVAREAAPFMRWNDPGASAAGLCAFLIKRGGHELATGGMISIDPPPPARAVDWKQFAGNQDVIVINVDQGSAKCLAGKMEGHEIRGLQLGGTKGE